MSAAPGPADADPAPLLATLRQALQAAVAALAGACRAGARPGAPADLQRLDDWQPECFELAWTAADLLAADTLWQAATASTHAAVDAAQTPPAAGATPGAVPATPLDLALARAFAAEAVAASLPRLQAIALALGLDEAPLQQLAASPAWAQLRRAAATGPALAALGQALQARAGEGGQAWAAVPLSEPLQMARDTFARFGAEQVAPLARAIHQQDLTVPESLLQPLRELGVFGLSIPERFGGIAPDDHDDAQMMVVVTEALSEASLGAAGSLITRPEILARALLAGGTPAQQQHWLPRIAAGEPLAAIAITEPDAGSDVAALQLKGTRVPGGWRLDGAKTWCTFAGKAGVLMVVTRTGAERSLGHKGLSLLLVEKPATDGHDFDHRWPDGGRLRGRAIPTLGYRGMHSYELAFEHLFVPDSHVIGGEAGLGQGFYFTMAGMMGGRLQTAARACGVMWAALKAALRYAQDRQVFGAALGRYGLTQAKLARMAARLAACRALTYAVARRMESGGSGRQAATEASLVKLLACRSAEWVTREAMQLHGGMGYAEETDVSRYFADARVLSIFEGAEETLALKVIARGLVEQALREPAAAR